MHTKVPKMVLLALLLATLWLPAVSAKANECSDDVVATVTIDHKTGVVNPDGLLTLSKGDDVCVLVVNTEPECFLYNLTEVTLGDDAKSAKLNRQEEPVITSVSFGIEHDGETDEYKIDITKKASCKSTTLPDPLSRSIRVDTYGWAVAFGGAYTVDQLVDPVFFLEAGSREKPGMPGEMEEGFFVRRRDGAEGSWGRGAATMLHLYHNDPEVLDLSLFGTRGRIHWVPLSFGLGVAGDSENEYFLGTGFRFGTKLFLTAGVVFGEKKRLPDKFALGDFTTDATALATLPERSGEEVFISVSYTFAGLDINRLGSPFKAKQTKPNPTTP